ncbi:helix-turn-helix domain-containing protein [Vibrio tritonius]|uniref:Helix-turn-helix domain-containing protein n=1 Tax=Vibrio tritonius TaxID=1435069 RepID=A0ABS7YKW7_9VIBR|nr:helix-turn-helix domain-containing protein [Vibrio tritonius]
MSTTTVHLPITDISHAVGFNEYRRMIAAFRKYCGVTPSEYRKNSCPIKIGDQPPPT